jgi:8-oxo-dGTP diphosphatase
VIHFNNEILAAKRLAGGPSGLKWEFPGGKVEAGESPHDALSREILEELGLEIEIDREIGTFSTLVSDTRINLQCFHCTAQSNQVVLSAHSEVTWCRLNELSSLDWALPDIPAIEALLDIEKAIG